MTRSPQPIKIETIRQMLATPKGTSLRQICIATGWQAHTARAVLSGLRKAGVVLLREAATEAGGDADQQSLVQTAEKAWRRVSRPDDLSQHTVL